jgi:hypothetical protein
MSLPAQAWTTVATTKIAGISRSMVSMYSGTYIRTIRPRPVINATCHFRFMRASSRSRTPPSAPVGAVAASPSAGVDAVRCWRGVAV